MKTPRRCCVRQKAGGMYIHLGLKAGLLQQPSNNLSAVPRVQHFPPWAIQHHAVLPRSPGFLNIPCILISRTNSPNPKASVISPDLANLILKNLEKIYPSLQRLHMKIDALVPTSSSEALNEPPLPLSSMDDLQKYEEHLRDGPRYAQLVERWLLQEAGDVQVYLTNVLTRTLAPRLAVLLNWRGINDKKAFGSTRLAQGLIYAATEKFPNTNPRQVKEIVHRWLENERQKVRKRLQRATKNDK